MRMLSEEGLWETDHLKAGPLGSNGQVVGAKEKFWKEIKSATSVNTWTVIRQSSLVANMGGKFSVLNRRPVSQNTGLSQSLIQTRPQLTSVLWRPRHEEAAEEKSEVGRGEFTQFEERRHLHNPTVQGEAASADVELIQESPLRSLGKAATQNNRSSVQVKQPDAGKRCHLRLS